MLPRTSWFCPNAFQQTSLSNPTIGRDTCKLLWCHPGLQDLINMFLQPTVAQREAMIATLNNLFKNNLGLALWQPRPCGIGFSLGLTTFSSPHKLHMVNWNLTSCFHPLKPLKVQGYSPCTFPLWFHTLHNVCCNCLLLKLLLLFANILLFFGIWKRFSCHGVCVVGYRGGSAISGVCAGILERNNECHCLSYCRCHKPRLWLREQRTQPCHTVAAHIFTMFFCSAP